MTKRELKRPRESTSPTGLELQNSTFKVFKMRKTINLEEESSEAQNSEELTIVVLSTQSPFSLQQIPKTTFDSPSSPFPKNKVFLQSS